MTAIKGFFGDYRFLSNFYESPVTIDKITYPTVEHYYQAMKAFNLEDHDWVKEAPTPGLAKYRGKRVAVREDWEKVKVTKMEIGLTAKFDQHENLKKLLMDTEYAELEETNQWNDTFWGVCRNEGKNMLGVLLMQIRAGYRLQKAIYG